MKAYSWKLKDIIMVSLLCIVFGVIYLGAVNLSAVFATLLTPSGLGLLGYEPLFGVWFMAATLTAYIVRKPGVAVIAEIVASVIEVLMGNMFGPMVIVAGLIQGAGAELVFAAFRYKKWNMKTMCLGAAGCCVTSFLWTFYRSQLWLLTPTLPVVMFCIRLVSSVLLSGILCKIIGDGLASTGLLKSYPIGAGAKENASV